MDAVSAKRAAAAAAALLVPHGCTVGLGTGSTAALFIAELGERARNGLRVTGVATSEATRRLALACGLTLVPLPADGVDIAVDGADEVDAELRLVKGGGGAMVRERIVAAAARRFIVIVDESKVCERVSGRVPVELLEFGSARTLARLNATGGGFELRRDVSGRLLRSDNGNLLADGMYTSIADPAALAAELDATPGVVGHGLFLGMADLVLVGAADGSVRELHADAAAGVDSTTGG